MKNKKPNKILDAIRKRDKDKQRQRVIRLIERSQHKDYDIKDHNWQLNKIIRLLTKIETKISSI